jgi:hypothetical protein
MTPPTPPSEGVDTANNAFVINLVSSTTPVALTRPDHAGLKRFTFFVSRRREDGRERFRLHMGYFDTQEEAEQLLDIVRSIYPGAWAGLAPGRRLGAAASPAAVTAMADAAAPERAPEPKPKPASPPAAEAATPKPVSTHATATLALLPDEGRRPLADVEDLVPGAGAPQAQAKIPTVQPPARDEGRAARNSLSNIRAAIASLEDSGIRSSVLDALPELQPAVIPVAQPVRTDELSDSATLRLLETGNTRRQPRLPETAVAQAKPASARKSAPVSVPKPASLKETAASSSTAAHAPEQPPREEKPCYAVQLMWAVQPIDMAQVPQLAIFSAYTLYGAEGNRDGRRWYGLRLGFFTDAVSAKQVAQYVRGDFATVSIVPVTGRERDHALKAASVTPGTKLAGRPAAAARPVSSASRPRPAATPASRPPEFAFIEGTGRPAALTAAPAASPAGARMIGGRPTRGAPGKRAKVRKPGQVSATAHVKPKTLEETLEILGANQLQVDDGSGPSINDSGVRHLSLETAKGRPSKLSRLIGRLSERIGS